jgi:hypothetical protein
MGVQKMKLIAIILTTLSTNLMGLFPFSKSLKAETNQKPVDNNISENELKNARSQCGTCD